VLLAVVLHASSCSLFRPAKTKRASGQQSVPVVMPPAENTDPIPAGLQADFRRAVELIAKGRESDAMPLLQELWARDPNPFVGSISALLMRQAYLVGDLSGALRFADTDRGGTGAILTFWRAVVFIHASRFEEAQRLLSELPESKLPNIPGVSVEETLATFEFATAKLLRAQGRMKEAFSALQRYHDVGRDNEKAFAYEEAHGLAQALTQEAALTLYQASQESLTRGALADQAARALAQQGDVQAAEEARAEADVFARGVGAPLDRDRAQIENNPKSLGLVVPLSGRKQALGLAVARGATVSLAATDPAVVSAPGGSPEGFEIQVRDDQQGASRAIVSLAIEERVIGLVGTPSLEAAEAAHRYGLPFLALSDKKPEAESTTFQLVHAPHQRVRALALAAHARHITRFAILRPETESARLVAEAFADAVSQFGGTVVSEQTYAARTTTFSAGIRELKRSSFEAVFVPEDARRLELIAPAFAVEDLWISPAEALTEAPQSTAEDEAPRVPIVLLSTARGLSDRLLKRVGRYVQGALLAPGFYADPASAAGMSFVSEFEQAFKRRPGATEAYGFDGVQLLRTCVDRGARTSEEVIQMLEHDAFEGATGHFRFSADHTRADEALVYEVRGSAINALDASP